MDESRGTMRGCGPPRAGSIRPNRRFGSKGSGMKVNVKNLWDPRLNLWLFCFYLFIARSGYWCVHSRHTFPWHEWPWILKQTYMGNYYGTFLKKSLHSGPGVRSNARAGLPDSIARLWQGLHRFPLPNKKKQQHSHCRPIETCVRSIDKGCNFWEPMSPHLSGCKPKISWALSFSFCLFMFFLCFYEWPSDCFVPSFDWIL